MQLSEEAQFGTSRKPCTTCNKEFAALVNEEVCHRCTEDEATWKRLRRKGDPRTTVSYEALIGFWQKRRAEVQQLRRVNLTLLKAHDTDWLKQELKTARAGRELAEMKLAAASIDPAFEARLEIQRLQSELDSARRQLTLADQWACIPGSMIKRLLQLIHPDKHNNSTAATEVTAWLLRQRQ